MRLVNLFSLCRNVIIFTPLVVAMDLRTTEASPQSSEGEGREMSCRKWP